MENFKIMAGKISSNKEKKKKVRKEKDKK